MSHGVDTLHWRPSTNDEITATELLGAGAWPEQQLYNTLTRRKEVFRPRPDQGNAVSMYVCGVTVYSMSHIGARRSLMTLRTACGH